MRVVPPPPPPPPRRSRSRSAEKKLKLRKFYAGIRIACEYLMGMRDFVRSVDSMLFGFEERGRVVEKLSLLLLLNPNPNTHTPSGK